MDNSTGQVHSHPEYKYNERNLINEIQRYVDQTYGEHYSQNKYQATEFILDAGHGDGFCIGNVLKYAQRYGHKGTPSEWRKDLLKVIHYAIIQLYNHDTKYPAVRIRPTEGLGLNTLSEAEALVRDSIHPNRF